MATTAPPRTRTTGAPSTGTGPIRADGDPRGDDLDGIDTGTRLVLAAAEVFAEKGYDGAGVAEIARRAGLTTGAIYSRFSGKAELLAETIRLCTDDEFDRLFAQHRFQGRATDLLETVGEHLVTREPTPGQAILLEAFVAARRDPEVAAMLRERLAERAGRLATMVDDTKAAGIVDEALDTEAIVHFSHAVGLGFLLFEAIGYGRPSPEAWQHLLHRIVTSVAAPDGAAPDGRTDQSEPNDTTEPDPGATPSKEQ